MSGALEKFGLYDFMGIWGPGAIAVTYYWATLDRSITAFLAWLNIELPELSELHMLIILYSAVAYIVGVILHETGKLYAERTLLFDSSIVKKNAYSGELPDRGFGWRIKSEYKSIVENTIPGHRYRTMNFDEAICALKYNRNISTKRIDTYHSVYALSRSLSLCFTFHILAESIVLLTTNPNDRAVFLIMIIDGVLAIFFLSRAYRYFNSWVRNAFVQYYMSTYADEDKISK